MRWLLVLRFLPPPFRTTTAAVPPAPLPQATTMPAATTASAAAPGVTNNLLPLWRHHSLWDDYGHALLACCAQSAVCHPGLFELSGWLWQAPMKFPASVAGFPTVEIGPRKYHSIRSIRLPDCTRKNSPSSFGNLPGSTPERCIGPNQRGTSIIRHSRYRTRFRNPGE